jgi:Zn-dependent oligopeptidase
MDALAQKMQPILTQHANDVRLNPRLFERIRQVHLHHRKLTPEEKMLLDNCYEGFVRSGALLDEPGKERLRQLKALAELIGSERDSMQAEANSILTLLGLNQSGNDSATMNMADKATYDQFELYLGIANAHLMVSEQHKQISEQILTTLQTIGNVGSGVNYQELIYMRLGTTNEYLLATKRLVSSIEAKMDTIAQQLSKL